MVIVKCSKGSMIRCGAAIVAAVVAALMATTTLGSTQYSVKAQYTAQRQAEYAEIQSSLSDTDAARRVMYYATVADEYYKAAHGYAINLQEVEQKAKPRVSTELTRVLEEVLHTKVSKENEFSGVQLRETSVADMTQIERVGTGYIDTCVYRYIDGADGMTVIVDIEDGMATRVYSR